MRASTIRVGAPRSVVAVTLLTPVQTERAGTLIRRHRKLMEAIDKTRDLDERLRLRKQDRALRSELDRLLPLVTDPLP